MQQEANNVFGNIATAANTTSSAIPEGYGVCRLSGEVCPIRHPRTLNLPWPSTLQHRRGGPRMLRGLHVFFDFDWRHVFGHDKGVFKKSHELAALAQREALNKLPTIILTTREDVTAKAFEWNDRYVLVININRYLRSGIADFARDFFAASLTSRVSQVADIEGSDIQRWANGRPDRIRDLQLILKNLGSDIPPAAPQTAANFPENLADLIQAVGSVNEELIELTLDVLVKGGAEVNLLLRKLMETERITDIADAVRWLLHEDNRTIVAQLATLEGSNLKKLSMVSSMAALLKAVAVWEENKSNGDEKRWQEILKEHSFILTQIFAQPFILFMDEAHVGGRNLTGHRENITDFLCKNVLTHNVAFVEIKTPLTPLVSAQAYRSDCFNISREISGAVIQVMSQRDAFVKECLAQQAKMRHLCFEAHNPECWIIAGNSADLTDSRQAKSFQLYRSSLNGVRILTFDELFKKIDSLVNLLGDLDLLSSREDEIFTTASDGSTGLPAAADSGNCDSNPSDGYDELLNSL
jgi:hypothetical protein